MFKEKLINVIDIYSMNVTDSDQVEHQGRDEHVI